ncbi:MAG: PRD domain-containing protein [Eubacteriales bacterium]|nr:PRD domain-containing protein [Eubacteriales bacterium]
MKSLFTENRMANILVLLRRSNEMKIDTLASILNVSERSIKNDIKQINEEMEDCAVIDLYHGRYVLRIYDAEIFRKKFSHMIESEDLNSPKRRMDYIFGKLMRSEEPILTDELAYEMNVGRTTMISDLNKLRQELESYEVEIAGKTSKGLTMIGSEIGIRRYVLENNYSEIYGDYPLDLEVIEILHDTMEEYNFDKSLRESVIEFTTLMLDRFLTGHYIGELTDSYYKLTARKEYEIIDHMMNQFEDLLHVKIPVEERLYVFLPVVGMRTPSDVKNMEMIMLDESILPLMKNILGEIKSRMNITIDSGDLTEEFLYHMMFMINRLRFGVKVNNPLLQDLKNKYPLAYQMSGIAAKVIEETYQVEVSLEEKGFLAFYFEVFLTKQKMEQKKAYKIAVICGTGRVSSRLISLQLERIVDSSTEITTFSDEEIDSDLLNQFDLILTTVTLNIPCEKAVIKISEIFNEEELLHKIEKIRYWNHVDIPMMDNNWFVMPGLIEENHFFYLEGVQSYEEAISMMVDQLVEDGELDQDFGKRLAEREEKGTMVFDESIAIPHCLQHQSSRIVLACGILPEPIYHDGQEIQLIFLMGIPEIESEEEGFLIRVYDELMSIATDTSLKQKLIQVKSFSELKRTLYRHS